MRYFSTFSGVEGFGMAMPSDWQCVGMSEIDKYCNMVLRYHYPDVKNYGDISAIRWNDIPDFDLLYGGSPCQDLSLAGKRKGLAGERSGLFHQFAKALREKAPEYFIWENVKGALSSNQGWDFAEVLNSFSEAGYNLWWQVLNAKDFGVPQNRERIFVIGSRTGSPSKVFLEREDGEADNADRTSIRTLTGEHSEGLHSQSTAIIYSGNSRKHESNRQGEAPNLDHHAPVLLHTAYQGGVRHYDKQAPTISTPSGGGHLPFVVQPVLTPNRLNKRQNGRRFKEVDEEMFTLTGQDVHGVAIMPTLTSNYAKSSRNSNGSPRPLVHTKASIRHLTPTECEALMSWPKDWTRWGINEKGEKVEISDTQRYKMCGNGVVTAVVRELIPLIEVLPAEKGSAPDKEA